VVYVGFATNLNAPIAIKEMSGYFDPDQERTLAVQQFRQEAQTLGG